MPLPEDAVIDPHWKRSFNAIFVAELIAIAGFSTTTPILPLYFRSLGVVDPAALNFWTGITNALPAISMAVFAPVWGSLADSYGRRLMLLRAMMGGAVLILLQVFTNAPWQILLLRTLQGCVTGTVSAATVLVAATVPVSEAGFRLGLMQVAVYAGSSLGPLLGGVISDIAGPRVNFLITSLLLLSAWFIVMRRVREEFEPAPKSASVFRNALPDFSVLATTPVLASLMVVTFSIQAANSIVGPFLPNIVMDMLGADSPVVGSMSGLIIASGAVSGALAAVAMGKVSGRIGYGRTLYTCMLGAAGFYFLQGFARTPWLLLAFRIGSGAFMGSAMPSVNALIAERADRARQGSTYGLSSSVANAGAAFGPFLGATLASTAGYPSVFFATFAVLLSVGFLVRFQVRAGPGAAS